MTISSFSNVLTESGRPRLATALGPARLTAGARSDGLPAGWDEHLQTYGDPHTDLRAGTVAALLSRYGVLGRGGAGFPLLIKMQAVAKAKGRPVVVVNASEGEPAIWKDRTLLSHVPHLVLDGAQLAAAALEADRIHIAVNPTFRPAHLALLRAIEQRKGKAGDLAPYTVHVVPDEFTAGEVSAVIGLINGGRGRPEFAKVMAAIRGVGGRPTLLSNTETYAQLALLARMGDSYGEVGAEGEPGTAVFTVRGAVAHDAVIEAPLGTTVEEVLEAVGGVTEPISAVLLGGYHGKWLPAEIALSAPLAVKEMRARGGSVGAGLIVPMPTDACPLYEVARVVEFLAGQSAGVCGPCVNGLPAVAGAVSSLAQGTADSSTLRDIERWSGLLTGRGNCKHPDGTIGFVASAFEVFGEHVQQHLHGPCGLPWRGVLPVDDRPSDWRRPRPPS